MPLNAMVAQNVIDAVRIEGEKLGKAFSIAVVDQAGYLMALLRMDGAGFLTPQIAEAKAFSAAAWQKPTAFIAERARAKPETFQAFINIGRTQLVPGEGGMPLWLDDEVVGAVGVSGGTSEEDELLCAVGVRVFGAI
jgi:glc operon protein GlcG